MVIAESAAMNIHGLRQGEILEYQRGRPHVECHEAANENTQVSVFIFSPEALLKQVLGKIAQCDSLV